MPRDVTLRNPHKRFPGDDATAVTTGSRQRTAQELRLLSYCLKSTLQSTENPLDNGDNGKGSECFAHLSECLMGGVIARHRIANGIHAYKMQDYKSAYRSWQAACRLCDNRELFYTLNYLISLSFDFGNFQKMLMFAVQQFQIGRYLNDPSLISESYLNLATSRGLLGNWELCLSYCKNCLLYLDASKVGYVYMSVACAYLELNQFAAAIGFLKLTFDICIKQKNYGLIVQVLVACGGMFYNLKSYSEAREFILRALEIAETVFSVGPGSARYRRTKVHLIPVQIKLRQMDESLELTEEAVRSALEYHDRYVQAKCMLYFADIHRLKADNEVAYQSYQTAAGSGYPYIQLRALLGQGKSVVKLNPNDNINERQLKALNIYEKALELATSLGCKLELLRSHRRMAKIQFLLKEKPDQVDRHLQEADQLCDEMKLFCNLCGGRYGLKRSQLKVLSCGHIFHLKCLADNMRNNSSSSRYYCVTCRSQSEDIFQNFLFFV